jgi:tetratricopeptide (TPR) repeat protein
MRFAVLLFGVVLGAGGVWIATTLVPPSAHVEPVPVVHAPAEASPDLEPILHRLDAIERRLAAIVTLPEDLPGPGRLSGAPAEGPGTAAATAPTDTGVAIDPDTLARAMEEVEHRRLDGLTSEQLRQEARRMMNPDRSPLRAQQILRTLLERDLEPEERSEVLTQLGLVQRTSGDAEGAETTFRKALTLTGIDTRAGVAAAGQLAWTLAQRKEYPEALRLAEDVLGSKAAEGQVIPNARWAIAVLSQASGDDRRAQAEYQRFLKDFGSDPQQAKLVQDVKRRLDGMP